MEVSPPPTDFRFIPSVPCDSRTSSPVRVSGYGTAIFHVWYFLSRILAADGSQDDVRIDHLLLPLRLQCQCVGHQVVDQAGAHLGVAVDGGKRRLVDDEGGPSGADDFVEDVLRHFRV